MVSSIRDLAAVSADLAITMVVPAERTGDNRAFDSHMNRMLAEVQEKASEFRTQRAAKHIVRSVRSRTEQLDRTHLSNGVWIGAYGDEVVLHRLDDDVVPQVSVANTLNLLPLVRQGRHTNALVLMLTETGCQLFAYHSRGETLDSRLRELRVSGLPKKFPGEGARKGRESEGEQVDGRYRHWLRDVAHMTLKAQQQFPTLGRLPLIVVGVDRYLGYLAEVSSGLDLSAVIHGSPDAFTQSELDSRLAIEVDWLRNDAVVAALNWATRAMGAGRTSVDAAETLRWAQLGRVDTLILEEEVMGDDVLNIALEVFSRAGKVLSAPEGSVAKHLPTLAPSRWVALLRW
jgi:hypothetical protein